MDPLNLQFSKNGALPLIYLAMVSDCETFATSELDRRMIDINRTFSFFEEQGLLRVDLGAAAKIAGGLSRSYLDDEIFETRYSIFLAAILAGRVDEFRIAKPGGCELGSDRVIDFHAHVYNEFGFNVRQQGGEIRFQRTADKVDVTVTLPYPSVGATLHAIFLAVRLGKSVQIFNAAIEPEIMNVLANLGMTGFEYDVYDRLVSVRRGGSALAHLDLTNIPDRIELGTLIFAAVAHRRKASFYFEDLSHIGATLELCTALGCKLVTGGGVLHVDAREVHDGDYSFVASPFPGFPTDLQPIAAAAMATITGNHTVCDTVFPNRFDYVPFFARMGVSVQKIEEGKWRIGGGSPIGHATGALPNIRSTVACYILQRLVDPGSRPAESAQMKRGYGDLVRKLDAILID